MQLAEDELHLLLRFREREPDPLLRVEFALADLRRMVGVFVGIKGKTAADLMPWLDAWGERAKASEDEEIQRIASALGATGVKYAAPKPAQPDLDNID